MSHKENSNETKQGFFKKLFSVLIPKKDVLLDRELRLRFNIAILSVTFTIVGIIFSIINFIKGENTLGIVTSVFSGISVICFFLVSLFRKLRYVAELCFVASCIILFLYFLVEGGAGDSGFSTYWILLLPFLTMMALGFKKGLITSAIMFLAICLLLWITPLRENILKWKPNPEFITRFPLVYLAAFVSSLLFEISNALTSQANDQLVDKLDNYAKTDFLTGLYNRLGLSEVVQEVGKMNDNGELKNVACILLDIDNFKAANDLYGHFFGDEVLVALADIMKKNANENEKLIRFGGDEFIVVATNSTVKRINELAENLRKGAEGRTFESQPSYRFTISAGVGLQEVTDKYRVNRLFELADSLSAKAKKTGKNRVYSLDREFLDNNK